MFKYHRISKTAAGIRTKACGFFVVCILIQDLHVVLPFYLRFLPVSSSFDV